MTSQRDLVGIDVAEGIEAKRGLCLEHGFDLLRDLAPRAEILDRGTIAVQHRAFDRKRGDRGARNADGKGYCAGANEFRLPQRIAALRDLLQRDLALETVPLCPGAIEADRPRRK